MATVTIPFQQSVSNTLLVSSSLSSMTKPSGEKEKERHVSPAPLGTMHSNIPPVIAPGTTTTSPVKAVKRCAAPSGGAGEKRKKALKRL
jgi:hypothetical protein